MITDPSYAKMNDPLLVLDMRNATQLPRHFRTSEMLLPSSINAEGFKALQMAGSGQFSKLALKKALEQLPTKKVLIVDLRQESHGFLNGNAITWYGLHNGTNAKKTPAEIESIEASLLETLGQEESVTVNKITKKTDGNIITTQPIEFLVHYTTTEEALAKDNHVNYTRLYVEDYHAPTPVEIDRFVEIAKNRPKEEWIYFHCRAGVGRTSTFMVMLDMMRNAKNISFEDALARQLAIGGKDLATLPSSDSYKYPFAKKRLALLKQFYDYAKENTDDYSTTFSDWLKQKH